jgi:hypothetical protein
MILIIAAYHQVSDFSKELWLPWMMRRKAASSAVNLNENTRKTKVVDVLKRSSAHNLSRGNDGPMNPLYNQAIQTGKKVLKGPKIEAGSEAIFAAVTRNKMAEFSWQCC